MPFINVKNNVINRKRNIISREGLTNSSLVIGTINTVTEPNNVFELILTFEAGETVIMGQVGSVISGILYKASNLKSDGKPAYGIILDDADAGDMVQIQIAGYCNANLTLTANKQVYLRAGTPNYSQTPLTAAGVSEDGFQILGTAISTNTLLINIKPFQQLT